MEGDRHTRLVLALANAMRREWPAAHVTEDLPHSVGGARRKVGTHVPDVIARTPGSGEIQAVGEAKPGYDLWSNRFKNQLEDWMEQGSWPICLITCWGHADELRAVWETIAPRRHQTRVRVREGDGWWKAQPGASGTKWNYG